MKRLMLGGAIHVMLSHDSRWCYSDGQCFVPLLVGKPSCCSIERDCSGQLVCAVLKTDVYGMENTTTIEVSLKTPSDYKAAIEQCLAQMQHLHEQMERDQEDIDRLRTETKALLAELKTG